MDIQVIKEKYLERGKQNTLDKVLNILRKNEIPLADLVEYAKTDPETTRDKIQAIRKKNVAITKSGAGLKAWREKNKNGNSGTNTRTT